VQPQRCYTLEKLHLYNTVLEGLVVFLIHGTSFFVSTSIDLLTAFHPDRHADNAEGTHDVVLLARGYMCGTLLVFRTGRYRYIWRDAFDVVYPAGGIREQVVYVVSVGPSEIVF
jgi:hypothetical protein